VRNRALALFLVLGLATTGASQPPVADPDVRRGIALVDEGEYDSAILTLDGAVRRLAADKGHSTRDLAEAYFYLGVAYLGKGHETSAKARFREAVQQARDMTPSPEKFPPRVIELFEKAKEESRTEMAAATSTGKPPSAEPKKKGGSKALLVIGGVALAGGGAALALGGGGGGGGATVTTLPAQQTFTASGTIEDGSQRFFTFVATRAGTAEAIVTWQDRSMNLPLGCALLNPPYRECPGTYNRTTDTSGRYTTSVVQDSYLISVSNYEGRAGAEPFTITIRYP
jgi:hypothetical protein